jgi:hypothetical protein
MLTANSQSNGLSSCGILRVPTRLVATCRGVSKVWPPATVAGRLGPELETVQQRLILSEVSQCSLRHESAYSNYCPSSVGAESLWAENYP